MFGMAGETEFDARFQIFGIPVRIHPIFWLSSAWLVWDASQQNPGLIFIGILCVLISVLVHELGHAFFIRRFGYPSEIVLYFLGGYATSTRFRTGRNIIVSFAGPAAGFLLYGLVLAIDYWLVMNHRPFLIEYPAVYFALGILKFANLFWNLLNLIPVQPLDGGQIMAAVVYHFVKRRPQEWATLISIAASGSVVLLAVKYAPGLRMLMIFFGIIGGQHVIYYNVNKRRY